MKRGPRDAMRAANAVLWTRALGVERASEALGIDVSTLSGWRKHLGVTSRLPNPGNTGKGKLSLEKAREIRAARAAGDKLEAIAALHGVTRWTIRDVVRGKLYPEPQDA